MKKVVLAALVAFALAPLAWAHEGHDHKFMGTVAAIHDNSIDVKAADGKTTTISLNDKTKIVHAKMAMKIADIKAGDRVIVTAAGGGKDPFVAKEVQLGGASAPAVAKKTTKK